MNYCYLYKNYVIIINILIIIADNSMLTIYVNK